MREDEEERRYSEGLEERPHAEPEEEERRYSEGLE